MAPISDQGWVRKGNGFRDDAKRRPGTTARRQSDARPVTYRKRLSRDDGP